MIGIPVEIDRSGKDETVYLSTRRSGERGQALRQAIRNYRDAERAAAKLQARMGLITLSVSKIPDDAAGFDAALGKLADEMDRLSDQAAAAKDAALEQAAAAVALALEDNHGDDAAEIMDCLTDRQIIQMIGIIETGETPEDFFPSRATRPSASTISPSAGAPGAHSSKPGSPAPTSKPAG